MPGTVLGTEHRAGNKATQGPRGVCDLEGERDDKQDKIQSVSK